jgi:hypothetical protein
LYRYLSFVDPAAIGELQMLDFLNSAPNSSMLRRLAGYPAENSPAFQLAVENSIDVLLM